MSGHAGELGSNWRERAIATLHAAPLDLIIIGGGIVGIGAALDATTRGLRVGLIEARDFGSGTSSRSSKLVHGGIRYLEQGDIALVREALQERRLLLDRLAPHLVHPVRFLYPVRKPLVERAYVGAGMLLYDLLGALRGDPGVPHHRHWTRRQVALAAPSLDTRVVRGGMTYFDGQVDDARYLITLARTASQRGAILASRVAAEGFLREAGRVVGVRAVDRENGRHFEIRARQVISAAGVWTDEIEAMLPGRAKRLTVRASKGIHILVPRERIHSRFGLLLRTEKSVLFVIPWGRFWLIGTTDTPWHYDKQDPAASGEDVDYVLARANSVLREKISRADVVGVFSGLRPLIAGASEDTTRLSREHLVALPDPGLAVIAGGKWTTYRVMAKDVVNAAAERLGVRAPSVTEQIPLLGAEGFADLAATQESLSRAHGVSVRVVRHLLGRYGSMTPELLRIGADRPTLYSELPGGAGYLELEAVYAARAEAVVHLEDILSRRLRLGFESRDGGLAAAARIAELVGPELGWSDERAKEEYEEYAAQVRASFSAIDTYDDAAANRERLKAPSR